MMRKLRSSRGETIAETLFSLVVATLAMVMLAGALVVAARLNNNAAQAPEPGALSSSATVTIMKSTSAGGSNITDHSLWSDTPYETTVIVTTDREGLVTYE